MTDPPNSNDVERSAKPEAKEVLGGQNVVVPVNPAPDAAQSAKTFLSFNYPELKDLGKHFLTLSSATAVFLVTFADKLKSSDPQFNQVIKLCMVSLLTAIAGAGMGLLFNYIAGSGASGAVVWGVGKDRHRACTSITYVLYLLAGLALFLAYALLTYATIKR